MYLNSASIVSIALTVSARCFSVQSISLKTVIAGSEFGYNGDKERVDESHPFYYIIHMFMDQAADFLKERGLGVEYGMGILYGIYEHPVFEKLHGWPSRRVIIWDRDKGFCFFTKRNDRAGRIVEFMFPRDEFRKYISTDKPGWEKKFDKKFEDMKKKINKYYLSICNRETMDVINDLD